MQRYQEKRILILGTTYPSYSTKYTELVCTGGIDEESRRMVRLYPIPLRYLDSAQKFHAFQWINVKATRDSSDTRPESLRVLKDSIVLGEMLEKHGLRRMYLEDSPNMCNSVEDLLERQKKDGTSLGIVIPKSIDGIDIRLQGPRARREWEKKAEALHSRGSLFGEEVKRIDFPEAKFYIRWTCNDTRCKGHRMSIHQWGIHELYRKYKDHPDCFEKVSEAMYKRLDQTNKDVFLYLGNFKTKQFNFGLMDSYSAPKGNDQQISLFS